MADNKYKRRRVGGGGGGEAFYAFNARVEVTKL